MDAGTLATIIAAGLGGGFSVEMVRFWKDRKKDQVAIEKTQLDMFYPTWKAEMKRLHEELALLRKDVLLLSAEVRRLGGDPMAIRFSNGSDGLLHEEPE